MGVNNEASPPGRHQEQAPKQRCTFSSTTFSSVQSLFAEYRHKGDILDGHGNLLPFGSSTGGNQGDPRMTVVASYAILPVVKWLDAELRKLGGFAVFISDDGYAVGPGPSIYPLIAEFRTRAKAKFDLDCVPSKCTAYVSDSTHDCPERPVDLPLSGFTDSLGAFHPGLMVAGSPVGSNPYVIHHLADKVATIVSDNSRLSDTLRGNHPHALWRILSDACNSQFTYWMQWNYVTDVRAVLGPLQHSLDMLLAASSGDPDILSDDITMQRVRLPRRLGGCGLRKMVDVLDAAFAGGLWRIAPRLISRLTNGSVLPVPGYHDCFEALFGIGAFNDDATNGVGRFSGLLGGNSRLRDEYMSAFLGCRDGLSVAQLGTGPLSGPIQDSGFGFETKGQMKITVQREELRKEKLTLLISALPVADMRRVAFISTTDSHTAKAFLSSWPDGDFNLPTDAWHMVFCTYLGLKVPFLKKFVGRLIGTSTTARVDAYGMALASAKLPGDHWRIRHDIVKHAVLFAVRGMGIAVNCEVYNLFATAFSPAATQHFTGPNSFGRCKGLVPDFEFKFNPRELGEVKGIVLGKVLYINRAPLVVTGGSSAYAVKARVQTIQREYERKAAAADTKFNGTLAGAQGPIAAKLATFGKVQALAFGWFGECSPALEHLLSRAADFGSQHLWQPMMAASQGKARGILMWKLRMKIGAAIVRANAMLLLDRVAHTGGDAAAAYSRQSRAESRFFRGGDPAEATYAHRLQRNAAPRWEAP